MENVRIIRLVGSSEWVGFTLAKSITKNYITNFGAIQVKQVNSEDESKKIKDLLSEMRKELP